MQGHDYYCLICDRESWAWLPRDTSLMNLSVSWSQRDRGNSTLRVSSSMWGVLPGLPRSNTSVMGRQTFQMGKAGAGDRGQWLRALAALPEDQDFIFSTYTAAYSNLTPVPAGLMPSTGLQGDQACVQHL